jgi:putative heme-binding domain-containing protein
LIAIIDPNRAYEARFAAFTIATVDGRVFSGLVAGESATTITLRGPDGKETALLRSQIETMAATGQSLMPEGLEKDLTPRDIADLIAYIAAGGPSRKAE